MVLMLTPLIKLNLTPCISWPTAAIKILIAQKWLFGEKNVFNIGVLCERKIVDYKSVCSFTFMEKTGACLSRVPSVDLGCRVVNIAL